MRAVVVAVSVAALLSGYSEAAIVSEPSSLGAKRPAPVRVVAAGDIATCGESHDTATGNLVRALAPRAVLTLGDNAYDEGSLAQFACYDAAWGSFRGRTFPSPGNHDYGTSGAAGYFEYFGSRAPAPYYSFNLGAWHLVSLNSEVDHGEGSEQVRWLRADLRADRHRCELLYWHRPRWSGGRHGSDPGVQPFWQAAYDRRVELVLTGHDHNYQRFAKQDAEGRRSDVRGVRHIVVGTGGRGLYSTGSIANRRAANTANHGVLALVLRWRSYDTRFVPVGSSSYRDRLRKAACA
ncbi:MAG TPA: metallophosphoesterase [Gaiellaceae bacterium]|nr:metallophosphoesterase [Gaiellaceae bacterium]